MRRMVHRIYFSPGFFGFGRLASYDYFEHLEKALEARFAEAGHEVETYVVEVPPTASVRRRAGRLAELVAHTADVEDPRGGPIHLVGHSTGGLDARLLASPGVSLPIPAHKLAWLPRLASVTTLNAPHYGTPLAAFFATVSGQRLLYALSALTFIALSVGSPPLAAASAIVMAIGRLDRAIGVEVRLLDRSTDALLRVLDDARSREVRRFLDAIASDQGAIIQLSPEAMELFRAGVENRPGIICQSVATMAPPPTTAHLARSLLRPWTALSSALFATMYGLTSTGNAGYPCSEGDESVEALLAHTFGNAPSPFASDGVVPIRSQLWGEAAWVGYADHLDVLGHFGDHWDDRHVDWMASGSHFTRARFNAMVSAIARGMLRGAREPSGER